MERNNRLRAHRVKRLVTSRSRTATAGTCDHLSGVPLLPEWMSAHRRQLASTWLSRSAPACCPFSCVGGFLAVVGNTRHFRDNNNAIRDRNSTRRVSPPVRERLQGCRTSPDERELAKHLCERGNEVEEPQRGSNTTEPSHSRFRVVSSSSVSVSVGLSTDARHR